LKNIVDSGMEERFDERAICVEERLKLVKVNFVDALSAEEGEN
jgi:hypothetical protein